MRWGAAIGAPERRSGSKREHRRILPVQVLI